MTPADVKTLRLRYALDKRDFAELLGWQPDSGRTTVHQLETGGRRITAGLAARLREVAAMLAERKGRNPCS